MRHYVMDNTYISRPTNVRRMEDSVGEPIDFRRTFDLNGTHNDEALRLYLKSAGLSDQIECLTAEQRRAFIYDIIRSNKLPGYWQPSTLKNSKHTMQRPTTRPPPPPATLSSSDSQNGTIRSNGSFGSLDRASPLLPQRFIPAPAPTSPTTFVTNAKGKRIEISGPMNFEHKFGDLTRDRRMNAFDLSATSNNDNVLRKYMMERGITEDDIAGMRRTDVIRKIVQSKFTWMPEKKKTNEQQLKFATISNNNRASSLKSSTSYEEISLASNWSSSPTNSSPVGTLTKKDAFNFSNFTLVTSRFADCSQFPAPADIYGSKNELKNDSPTTMALPPLPPNAKRPAPPPRKSQPNFNAMTEPTTATTTTTPPQPYTEIVYDPNIHTDYDNAIETIPLQRYNQANADKPHLTRPLYVTLPKPNVAAKTPTPPASGQAQIPAMTAKPNTASTYIAVDEVFMAKQLSSSISKQGSIKMQPPTPPKPTKKKLAAIATFPTPPPPPPPMPPTVNITKTGNGIPPPPPPMPSVSAAFAPLPPPPPPTNSAMPKQIPQNSQLPSRSAALPAAEDGRDAFLESIRKGVALKKVNQKAATISGVKPRAERKPPVNDFLSELKLGITLRRTKNPEDNPFSLANDEADESHA